MSCLAEQLASFAASKIDVGSGRWRGPALGGESKPADQQQAAAHRHGSAFVPGSFPLLANLRQLLAYPRLCMVRARLFRSRSLQPNIH